MYRLAIRHLDRILHAFADRGVGVDGVEHFVVGGFEFTCGNYWIKANARNIKKRLNCP